MYAMERAIARGIYADILDDMQDIGYLEPSLADYYLEKMGDLPGKEISPFEPIMQDDVVLVQEGIDEILPDSARDLESVLGKRSTQSMYEGEQLLTKKLTDSQLLPEKGQAKIGRASCRERV